MQLVTLVRANDALLVYQVRSPACTVSMRLTPVDYTSDGKEEDCSLSSVSSLVLSPLVPGWFCLYWVPGVDGEQ